MLETQYLTVTRAAYDTIASDYARVLDGALARMSWDRAVLCTFVELVARDRLGPVADVGCGTGRITGYLHHLGLDVVGIDLSPGMLAVARQALPGLCFVEGSMTALDLPDASFGGVVAWYSLIHIAPLDVPAVLTELCRVLVPGAHLLLAFQVGDQRRHLEQAYGHAISLDAYRMQPDQLAQQLDAAGMAVYARVVRAPEDPETEPQAYLLARKSAAAPPESAAVSAGNTSWGSISGTDRARSLLGPGRGGRSLSSAEVGGHRDPVVADFLVGPAAHDEVIDAGQVLLVPRHHRGVRGRLRVSVDRWRIGQPGDVPVGAGEVAVQTRCDEDLALPPSATTHAPCLPAGVDMSGGSGGVGAGLAGAARSTTDPVGLQDHAASVGALGPSTITRPAIPLRTHCRSTND